MVFRTRKEFNLKPTRKDNFRSSKRKENKYFGTIVNNTQSGFGEITFDIYGKLTVNGIKGFFSTVRMVFVNPTTPQAAELYSVSSNYVMSSY